MTNSYGRLTFSFPDGGKQEFRLSKTSVTLGRHIANDIVVRDNKASRAHATLECSEGGCVLTDLGSANGTFVNGIRIQRATLVPGDMINLGDSSFQFETSSPELDPDMTVPAPDQDDELLAQTPLTMEVSETSGPRLAVHTPARTWEVPLTGDALSIGRHPENDVVLDSSKVSRRHARIERNGDMFVLIDLNSDNGSWLGQQRVTRQVLQDGDTIRIGNARMAFKAGFGSGDLTVADVSQRGEEGKRRPVVVVPGFAGSNLFRGSQQVWPQPRLLLSEPEILRFEEPFEPRGLVHEVVIVPHLIKLDKYSYLVEYLKESLGYESGKDLLEFAYDFRQDIRVSSRQLAAMIEGWGINTPITIVAHSMGCLVSRYYIEKLGGKKKVERIILLGGPQSGTPYSFASLLRGPGLLPFGLRNERLRDVLASFPSWYQLLPIYPFVSDRKGCTINVLADSLWLPEEQRPMLRFGVEIRAELGKRSSIPTVCIFGYGLKTITRAVVDRDPAGLCQKLDLEVAPVGDGTIPESSAVMEGAEIHPVRQYHGALYVDNDVKMRLKVELTR